MAAASAHTKLMRPSRLRDLTACLGTVSDIIETIGIGGGMMTVERSTVRGARM
jgi:hypothetical protein